MLNPTHSTRNLVLMSDDGYTYRWDDALGVWTDGDVELQGNPRGVELSQFDVGDMVPGFTIYEGGVEVRRFKGVDHSDWGC